MNLSSENFFKNFFKKKELTRKEKFKKDIEDERALRNLIISSGGQPGGYSPSKFAKPLGSPPKGGSGYPKQK